MDALMKANKNLLYLRETAIRVAVLGAPPWHYLAHLTPMWT